MKIKTISRTEEDYVRKSKNDISKVFRNRDPVVHPFEKAREYTRAVVATKLDKMFAKPFIGVLDGHRDAVCCMSGVRNRSVPFISGACDGEVRVWDMMQRTTVWSASAHSGFVRGICTAQDGNTFFSCGDDKIIKHWALQPQYLSDDIDTTEVQPLNTIVAAHPLKCMDHHWADKQYATGGAKVCIWDSTRSTADPTLSYTWGAETVLSLKFNPAEACLLGSTGSDRSVCLYDLRSSQPMKKFMLAMISNKIAWNPMEPFNFCLANEDHNLYTFDMRNLSTALMIHKDHVGAVMDVAYSPTGKELVSAGWDRTIRIFKANSGKSREVYHSKRMARVFTVSFSADSKFILSGSDDTNIRIWKAKASEAIGQVAGRQERKQRYNQALVNRFKHMPDVKRIVSDVKVPKYIKKAKALTHVQNESMRRKRENRLANDPSAETPEPQRKRAVVKEFDTDE